MKKLLALLFISISFINYSQNNWCGFDEKLEKHFQENPNAEAEVYERFDRISNGQINAQDRVGPYYIPVVVHIIHDGAEGNISYAQVADAIDMLNNDFNRTSWDASVTRNTVDAPFLPNAADLEINFVLAKLDPNGNCTNGVEKRDSPQGSYEATDDSKTYNGGGLDAWDRNKYFNIWIVNSIESSGTGTTLGYAQFPMWGSANTYGVIIRHDAFGNIGTANGDRTITHEVGHCLGLFHTFQDGCGSNNNNCSNQGDGCCDTPPVDEPHWSCSSSQNSCTQIPNNDDYGFDAFDQYENFMSYSPCQNMFSEDQKSICTANLSNIGHLSNLVSSNSQISSGINLPDVLCKADFVSSQQIVCAGTTIDFTDNSFHNINTRSWIFNGGTPSVSSDSVVSITYNTPGVYAVSLEVSDGSNTETDSRLEYITVMPNPGVSLPYTEGFETVSFPDNYNFFVYNQNNDSEWELTSAASSSGEKSIKLQNYGQTGDAVDGFTSGPIDLGVLDPSENLLLTFKYAYNQKNSSDDESLRIFVSNDCGENWSLRKNIFGSFLSENVAVSSSYTPTNSTDWISVTIDNIHGSFYVPNFRYKMEFTSGEGNNIYIDDINLYPESWLGITPSAEVTNFSVYPNPTKSEVNISIVSAESQKGTIVLFNSLGKIESTIFDGVISQGDNNFNTSLSNLSNGIYYVRFIGEFNSKTLKISKN